MFNIPTNIISYILAGIATTVVGIRSTQNYQKFHSALSRHFALSGFLAAAGLFLYSLPYLITGNEQILKVCLLLGRAALDAVAYLQIFLIWYLTGLKKLRLRTLVWPLVIIGTVGYISQVLYVLNAEVGIKNGVASYSYSPITIFTHAFSLIIVFVAGLILARQSVLQTQLRARVRLLSVAILYIFASAADLYNTVFLNGSNNSWIVLFGFMIAAGVFLVTTILFSRKTSQV